MNQSVFYRTQVVQRPQGVRDWASYVIGVSEESGFDWKGGEEQVRHIAIEHVHFH